MSLKCEKHIMTIVIVFIFSLIVVINLLDYTGYSMDGVFINRQSSQHVINGTRTLSENLSMMSARKRIDLTSQSREFPGMPNPCADAWSNHTSGVEDLLCKTLPKFLPEYKNPCFKSGTKLRCLPYFHLIGVGKSGTTDFFNRLYQHPDILPNSGHMDKETWYWTIRRYLINYYHQTQAHLMTLDEFMDTFDVTSIKASIDTNGYHYKITGHGDPMDFFEVYHDDLMPQNRPGGEVIWTTPHAIKHINPNIKLLLLLRDPIDRLYSYYFWRHYGNSSHSFHDDVVKSIAMWRNCLDSNTIKGCVYSHTLARKLRAPILSSMYVVYLKEWLTVFPRQQLYVFRNEDYTKDIKGTMSDVCRFLNISIPSDDVFKKMETEPRKLETKSKSKAGPMLPETRTMLVQFFRPFMDELGKVLNNVIYAFRDTSFG